VKKGDSQKRKERTKEGHKSDRGGGGGAEIFPVLSPGCGRCKAVWPWWKARKRLKGLKRRKTD